MGTGRIMLCLILAWIIQYTASSDHDPWSYNMGGKADQWSTLYPNKCGANKKRQSPINIELNKVIYEEKLKDFNLLGSDRQTGEGEDKKMVIFNNGRTVQVNVMGADIFLVGGLLGDVYKVAQFHFHWGHDNTLGSEHRVDGRTYPFEMHIVTYDTERYTTVLEALTGFNSIAVISVLFEIDSKDNVALNPVIKKLKDIKRPNKSDKIDMAWVDLSQLLPQDRSRYYRYDGSLTTPSCNEVVLWSVFNRTSKISSSQLAQFRKLYEGDYHGHSVPLQDNFRPPQPLGIERAVYSSFPIEFDYNAYGENGDDEEGSNGYSHLNKTTIDDGNNARRSYLSPFVTLTAFSILIFFH